MVIKFPLINFFLSGQVVPALQMERLLYNQNISCFIILEMLKKERLEVTFIPARIHYSARRQKNNPTPLNFNTFNHL